MKLETKYGVLEGTVEEFKELLEDKKDLSYLSGEAEEEDIEIDVEGQYFVVTKDIRNTFYNVRLDRGTILKKEGISYPYYIDSLGIKYSGASVEVELNRIKEASYKDNLDSLFREAVEKEILLVTHLAG